MRAVSPRAATVFCRALSRSTRNRLLSVCNLVTSACSRVTSTCSLRTWSTASVLAISAGGGAGGASGHGGCPSLTMAPSDHADGCALSWPSHATPPLLVALCCWSLSLTLPLLVALLFSASLWGVAR
eukprot:scaffold38795_cov47-Phaeocystis_antarctica.AAC.4